MSAAARPNLRDPGSILLLSCYELGHSPLGVASPAGFLAAAGYRAALQDLATERLDADRVRQARFVGISVPMHTALRLGVRVAERVRSLNPTCHICLYGLYASLNEHMLLEGVADSVIGAEYEPALVELVRSLEVGSDESPAGVSRPGHRAAPRLARTSFALPSRAGLPPLDAYARLVLPEGTHTVGYVEASRGCKHHCRHCPIPPVYGGRFFVVPRQFVLEDIAALVAQGAEHITFGDPDFLNGPGHALRLVEALHERFPALSYDFTAKVEHLIRHEALLPTFARTGCRFIVSAVESLSDRVLAALDKGHTHADVLRALEATRRAGIALRPTFVAFTPWTTLEDYVALLRFVAGERLIHHVDPVQLAIRLLVPPGSDLLESPEFLPFRGELEPEALTYRWRHPDARMDALQATVQGLVETAAREESPAEQTFASIVQAALSAAGGDAALAALVGQPLAHPPAPRLTEPWFC